jgi:hypothetical protein
MALFRLTRIQPLGASVNVEHGADSFEAVEFEPSPSKKYVISIEVGNQPPSAVAMQIQRLHTQLKGFFPDGSYLIVPARDGHPVMGIYELDPVT